MSRHGTTAPVLALLLLVTALAAPRHALGEPTLHVGTEYEECYLDLHPELTAEEFRTFTAEGSSVVRFQQLAGAQTLGDGTWAVGLALSATPIDDSKGAWNNTFSHPTADHWLGDVQRIPRITVR